MLRSTITILLSCTLLLLNACTRDSNSIGCTTEEDCREARVCLDGICSDEFTDVVQTEDINETPDINTTLDTQDLSDIILDVDHDDDIYAKDIENDSTEPNQDTTSEDIEEPFCPNACDRGCLNGVCYIEGLDLRPIQCPDGMDCHVLCSSVFSCDNTITCGDGKCTVECEGDGSCSRVTDCADSSQCTVRCLGAGACDDEILCGSSDCSVECGRPDNRDNTCSGGIDCGTNSCQVACLDEESCTRGRFRCEDEDCDGAFTCNEADYCRCMGPGCWPTPD